jgi:hypothetical protein
MATHIVPSLLCKEASDANGNCNVSQPAQQPSPPSNGCSDGSKTDCSSQTPTTPNTGGNRNANNNGNGGSGSSDSGAGSGSSNSGSGNSGSSSSSDNIGGTHDSKPKSHDGGSGDTGSKNK